MNDWRRGVLALIVGAACTAATAAPVTFFGEDINGGGPNNARLTAFPNSDAAKVQFLSNLQGVGTETFEGVPYGYWPTISLTFPGAGSATLVGNGWVNGGVLGGRYAVSGVKYFDATTTDFRIVFGSPIAAFGFYGTDIGDYGGHLTLTLTDTNDQTTVLSIPNVTSSNGEISGSVLYFGFYDRDVQYKSMVFGNDSTGDQFGFDDMTIGSLAQIIPSIPEPESYAMMLAGLGLIGTAVRRNATKYSAK